MGLLLQPVLLDIFSNGLTAVSSSLKITPNWGKIVDTLKVRAAIHRDPDRLEEWASRNQLKFIKDKHQVLPLGRKLWCKDTGWSLPCWEQLCGTGPGRFGRHKLGTSQQCALAAGMANSFLGGIHRGAARTSSEGFMLLCSACLRPRLKYCTQFCLPNTRTTLTNWSKFSGGPQGEIGRAHV